MNRIGFLAGTLWATLVLSYAAGYFGGAGGGQARGTAFLDAVFFFIALLLPLGIIGLAAWLAAELARQREAVAALVSAAGPLAEALAGAEGSLARERPLTPHDLDQVMRACLAQAQVEIVRDLRHVIESRAATAQEAQRPIEDAPPSASARLVLQRSRVVRSEAERRVLPESQSSTAENQPELPTMEAKPEEALCWEELIRAFDFPKDPEDKEGFRALRRALKHHNLAQMLQAAEDVLNLLSQEGVYMDDLEHEPGPAQSWRAFAEGQRGSETHAIMGIKDPHALDTVKTLMKSDPIFRDTALFFQHRFDGILRDLARTVSADDALVAVADTRSGRAFMLCAHASGALG